jgi:hypothetical protein
MARHRIQKCCRAPSSSWWLTGSNAGQCRPIDRRKDRWRTSEGDNLGREFGDNDPAGWPSRKCRDGEQGRRQTSHTKTIASGVSFRLRLLIEHAIEARVSGVVHSLARHSTVAFSTRPHQHCLPTIQRCFWHNLTNTSVGRIVFDSSSTVGAG